MKVEVRYLSKGGNTAKIAEAIASAAGVIAGPITEPVPGDTELLFVGGAVYGFDIDDDLKRFIAQLPQSVKSAAVFSTTAAVKSAFPQMSRALKARGIQVCEMEFHCRGEFKFMHKGRPNADDLKNAGEFARLVLSDGSHR